MPSTAPEDSKLAKFGANVCRARTVTQKKKLAELMEVNPRTVQKIEVGTTILRLQSALGCSWNSLMVTKAR